MAEYTDLDCKTPLVAQLVLDYLHREVADVQECESDAPRITAYVEKSTVRITYHDLDRNEKERHGWDMMLAGFRDGVTQVFDCHVAIASVVLEEG